MTVRSCQRGRLPAPLITTHSCTSSTASGLLSHWLDMCLKCCNLKNIYQRCLNIVQMLHLTASKEVLLFTFSKHPDCILETGVFKVLMSLSLNLKYSTKSNFRSVLSVSLNLFYVGLQNYRQNNLHFRLSQRLHVFTFSSRDKILKKKKIFFVLLCYHVLAWNLLMSFSDVLLNPMIKRSKKKKHYPFFSHMTQDDPAGMQMERGV